MALQGTLKEIGLGDVLQTVLQIGHKGLLRVRRGSTRSTLYISPEAVRLVEPEIFDDDVILAAFVERGIVPAAEADRARAVRPPGDTALVCLERWNLVPPGHVDAIFSAETEDHVLELLTWKEGDFRFEEGAPRPDTKSRTAAVALDPQSLMLSAAQRQDERREIDAVIGPDAWLILPTGTPCPALETPDDPVARVLARLDGKALLDEIALREAIALFAARKAACRLVEAKAARLATITELSTQASTRAEPGDRRGAAGLYRQWHAASPSDATPLVALATLAAQGGRRDEEADAMKTLGRVHLAAKKYVEARSVYERLLEKNPGDRETIEGLRDTAKLSDDAPGFALATRRLAEVVLEGGDAGQASGILRELLEEEPSDLEARILRTKALARLADRDESVEEFEQIAALLPRRCKTKIHRDAALYCRDAVARIAPDRTDLWKKFRSRVEAAKQGRRRAAMVGALVVVLGCAGWVFWPVTASSLLGQAKESVAAGDRVTAFARIADLADRFPESPELEEAMALRQTLMGAQNLKAPTGIDDKARAAFRAKIEAARAAFPAWPAPDAVEKTAAFTRVLDEPNGTVLRSEVTKNFKDALLGTLARLRTDALIRRDSLDAAGWAAAKPPADLHAFRDLVAAAQKALDTAWTAAAPAAVKAARSALAAIGDPALSEPLRGLEQDIDAAIKAAERRAKDVTAAAHELCRAEIEDAYEKARTEAVRPLVQGRLDEAAIYYDRLGGLVAAVQSDPALAPVRDLVERRGIRDFAMAKLDMMARVRKGLDAAKAAEAGGDLATAAAAYSSLVRDFDLIRFDEVFTVPLRVVTVPAGATVSLNGHEAGPSPIVVRYGWGSQSVVTVEAPGYGKATLRLKTADPKPPGEVKVGLSPTVEWTQPLSGVIEAKALGVDGDVVVANRSGRVERRAKATGEVRWAADLEKLEGVRARPAFEANSIWVPLLDGHLVRLSWSDGSVMSRVDLPGRPVGDAAALSGAVAVATDHGVLVARGASSRTVASEAPITAGVLAAHGAFWVGDARGRVSRVTIDSDAAVVLPLGGKDAVVGLASASCGVLALTADGALSLVDPEGKKVVWKRDGLGEAVGDPAAADGVAACADRGGLIHLFAACDGTPMGTRDLGAEAKFGLLSIDGRLAAMLSDGRLWVFAPKTGTVQVDVSIHADVRRPPADLGDGSIALPVAPLSLSIVPLPKR